MPSTSNKRRVRSRNPWAICTAAGLKRGSAKFERCVMQVKSRMNPAVSAVWPKMTPRQRWIAMELAGVIEMRARALSHEGWMDLPDDVKGMLLRSWNMGSFGTTKRRGKGETTRRMPVLTNPTDGWAVTHDGETLKQFGIGTKGANAAFAWLHKRQGQSVDWSVRYSGYDMVNVEGGRVVYSYKRSGLKSLTNPKVFSKEGKVLQRSKNLRGIREYVRKHPVNYVGIHRRPDGGGTLYVFFDTQARYKADFASYDVLKDFVRKWNSVYGVLLTVEGRPSGTISYRHPALQPGAAMNRSRKNSAGGSMEDRAREVIRKAEAALGKLTFGSKVDLLLDNLPLQNSKEAAVLLSRLGYRRNGTKGAYPFSDKQRQYRAYTVPQLRFALKDAADTARLWKGQDPATENWYRDDVFTIHDEIKRREGVKNPLTAQERGELERHIPHYDARMWDPKAGAYDRGYNYGVRDTLEHVVRKYGKNPTAPVWMKSDEAFYAKFGTVRQRLAQALARLTDAQKREFHQKVEKSLSEEAVRWALRASGFGSLENSGTQELPIEANKDVMTRTVKFLRRRGVKARIVEVERGRYRVRVGAGHNADKLMNLITDGPWKMDDRLALTPRQEIKLRAHARRHGPISRPGEFAYWEKARLKQAAHRNPARGYKKYYVARARHPLGGVYWLALTSMDFMPSNVIGKVFLVSAKNKKDAILEIREPEARWLKK